MAYRRRTPIPLYGQVADALKREIHDRGLRPGDFLSTEEALEGRFGVSRATIRRALEELVAEGLIERIPSKGTYVARRPVEVRLPLLRSFTETIADLGMTPSARVLDVTVVAAPDDVGVTLDLDEGASVIRVERLRYADGEPLMYLVDYLPESLGIGVDADFAGSLYALLAAHGCVVAYAEHVIVADGAAPELARAFGVDAGHPVLRMHCTSYDAEGRPLLHEEVWCRSERYRYAIRLARGGGAA
jgi:GntR family transcriptional regulator